MLTGDKCVAGGGDEMVDVCLTLSLLSRGKAHGDGEHEEQQGSEELHICV